MEMEGMGLNRKDGDREHGYGRLDDDWDDHEVGVISTWTRSCGIFMEWADEQELMNPNMPIEPPRRQASGSGSGCGLGSSNQYFDRPVPRPPSRTSSDKRLPPVPQSSKDQDPFAHDDDFASSGSFLQPKREPSSGRVRTMEEGWNTFQHRDSGDGNGRRDAGKDVWKGRTIEGSVNSPTSSRGTRDSAQTSSEENPFR